MVRVKPITPYRQGQLDGLCGIYATVNAFRLVVGADGKHLHRQHWNELFYVLLSVADDCIGAVAATAWGIDTKPLRKVLKAAARHMADEHEIKLIVAPLLPRNERPTFHQLAIKMSELLQQPGCAIIASFEDLDHWSVVQSVSDRWLHLFDSIGRTRLRMSHCRMSYEPPNENGLDHVLHRQSIFQVKRASSQT